MNEGFGTVQGHLFVFAALIIASICTRYFSRARRPAAVRRYCVRGTRPSNDLSHATYCASSSLRACTLRFPSVVRSRRLRSLNDSHSLAARALTIPRRRRSWISRSRSRGVRRSRCSRESVVVSRELTPLRSTLACRLSTLDSRLSTRLATVLPRNHQSDADMQAAETGGHEAVSP